MDHKSSNMRSCVFMGMVVGVSEEVITGEGEGLGEPVGGVGVVEGTGVALEDLIKEDFLSRCIGWEVRVGKGESEGTSVRQASRRIMTGSRTRERILNFMANIKFGLGWLILYPV